MKLITLIILSITIWSTLPAQNLPLPNPELKSDWQRIYIKNVGNIDIPPTMEIRSGELKEFTENYRKVFGLDAAQVVIQQAGQNELDNESSKRYARVMIETTVRSANSYEKLNFNITKISKSEIDEMNQFLKENTRTNLTKTGSKLIEWYPASFIEVNGMSCLHMSYTRQLGNNPIVLVKTYLFQNFDRSHSLSLSYQISLKNEWENDFENILNSFRITNIK